MHKAVVIQRSFHSYSHYVQFGIQTYATILWVPADIVRSSPTHMGYIHTLIQDNICKQRSCKLKANKHHDLKLSTC